MTRRDAAATVDRVETGIAERTDRAPVSTAMRYVRRAAGPDVLAGAVGGVNLLRGYRAVRRGDRRRGLVRVLLGVLFVAVAVIRRRSAGADDGVETDIDRTDVVDTAPDIEDVGGTGAATEGSGGRHSADEAAAVVDTSPDVEDLDLDPSGEPDRAVSDDGTTADAAGEVGAADAVDADTPGDVEGTAETGAGVAAETYERLGEAAFDEHAREVPVPQHAFDRRVLSLGDEAFWGVRASDDAVVVTGRFDSLRERDGIRYVASSRIDEERTLQVPDTVTNHWDEVAGGGTAVAGGDDLVFAIVEDTGTEAGPDTEAADRLLVVPEQWVDDVPGLGDGERDRAE